VFLRRAARCRITDQIYSEYIREKLKKTDNTIGLGQYKTRRDVILKYIPWGHVWT
jgi:hypothetical protein